MILRGIAFLLFAGAIAISCNNEPYDKAELAVTTLTNHDSSTSLNFKYRGEQLYTFQSLKGSTTLASMRFNYSGTQLLYILTDSVTIDSVTSYKLDRFYGYGTSTVIDSTKLYVDTTSAVTLLSVRTVIYDENVKPISVDLKSFTATGIIEQTANLTWDGGNVVELVTTNVNTGATQDIFITHDSKNGVYKFPADYIYTLSLQKLYWLSEHNPIAFDDGTTTKKYIFNYNKFDYPTTFKTEVNTLFGVTYLNR
jgi:hypothetical protein